VRHGAYLQLLTPVIPSFSGLMMTGCYKIPALSFEQTLVFTNKMSTDAYRGAGRPEAAFIAERTMEMVAADFGLDPADVRRKNFIPKAAFPAATAGGLVYDSGDYDLALDKALEVVDYKKMRARSRPRSSRKGSRASAPSGRRISSSTSLPPRCNRAKFLRQ
jgi:aerobic carbon-monoxide dehydrogenase large subunit